MGTVISWIFHWVHIWRLLLLILACEALSEGCSPMESHWCFSWMRDEYIHSGWNDWTRLFCSQTSQTSQTSPPMGWDSTEICAYSAGIVRDCLSCGWQDSHSMPQPEPRMVPCLNRWICLNKYSRLSMDTAGLVIQTTRFHQLYSLYHINPYQSISIHINPYQLMWKTIFLISKRLVFWRFSLRHEMMVMLK